MSVKSGERKHQILQALATLLENPHRIKITIATLATQLGMPESSLYKHFPSKSKMFEALIEFIEQTLFALINKILQEEECGKKQIERILLVLLGFSQRNPGMTRILIGDALVTENECLQLRINRLHDRLEATLKQALRFAITEQKINPVLDVSAQAELLMCFVVGSWSQFVKSGFERDPLKNWTAQRLILFPGELYGEAVI